MFPSFLLFLLGCFRARTRLSCLFRHRLTDNVIAMEPLSMRPLSARSFPLCPTLLCSGQHFYTCSNSFNYNGAGFPVSLLPFFQLASMSLVKFLFLCILVVVILSIMSLTCISLFCLGVISWSVCCLPSLWIITLSHPSTWLAPDIGFGVVFVVVHRPVASHSLAEIYN